jgi:hypothetical protein
VTDQLLWPASPPEEPPTDPPPADELPPPPAEGRAVAGLWSRLGGFALEVLLVPCTFVFGWVGWWIIAWADGQSPSKVVLHLHVVNAEDGRVASFGRMALREALGKGVGALLVLGGAYFALTRVAVVGAIYAVVGVLPALFDTRRRTIWDRMARTVVVEGEPPPFTPPIAPEEPDTALW